jgi:ElaB/YqjD/DUF883 family membrane-anchored ribosome-binding protein
MDKVKITYDVPENVVISINGIDIEISPFLNLSQQIVLINHYIEDYFSKSENKVITGSDFNYLEAEYNLMYNLLQVATNIDVDSIIPEAITSPLSHIHSIPDHISNYGEFRNSLSKIVDDIKWQKSYENSIGSVLSNFVDKSYEILEKISNISPKEIEEIQKKSENLLEELKDNSLIGIKEAPKKRAEKKAKK